MAACTNPVTSQQSLLTGVQPLARERHGSETRIVEGRRRRWLHRLLPLPFALRSMRCPVRSPQTLPKEQQKLLNGLC